MKEFATILGGIAGFCLGGIAWYFACVFGAMAYNEMYPTEDDFVNPALLFMGLAIVIGFLPAVGTGGYVGARIVSRLFRDNRPSPKSTQ